MTELSDKELIRYSRQILLDGWDIDAQLNLKSSRVVVVGAGGLGCPVLQILTRAGVGDILIIDDDVIAESNLQRQTLFVPSDVGELKAKVACQVLRQVNEFININYMAKRLTEDIVHEIFNETSLLNHQFNLIIDCTDNFKTRFLLNQTSVKFSIPLLSTSAIAMTGQLALFEPNTNNGCYCCVFDEPEDELPTCVTSGVLASTTAIMGSLQANLALQFLALGTNPLAGKLLLWEGRHLKQSYMSFNKKDDCSVCSFVKEKEE